MASDGIRAAQFPAKHSLNGSWMSEAIQATAVVSVIRHAAVRLSPRLAGRSHAATGRHARSRGPVSRQVPPRHAARTRS
jgi:hypothetical protein